jgi:hypothetical protein
MIGLVAAHLHLWDVGLVLLLIAVYAAHSAIRGGRV